MSKYLAVCLVLVFASVTLADIPTANYSWEDGGNGNPFYWWGSGSVTGQQTIGVTDGSWSCQVIQSMSGWSAVTAWGLSSFISNVPFMSFDLSVDSADLNPGTTVDFFVGWQGGGGMGGWNTMDPGTFSGDDTGVVTKHIVITFAGLGADWGSFGIGVNWSSGDDQPSNIVYYVDNIIITPEPATMALMGLGGLALLRRKK